MGFRSAGRVKAGFRQGSGRVRAGRERKAGRMDSWITCSRKDHAAKNIANISNLEDLLHSQTTPHSTTPPLSHPAIQPPRFAGGVLGTRFSSRLMLGGGLFLTALINITFGFFHSVTAFTALWFLNGSLQA